MAGNIGQKKATEELRRKIEEKREKRKLEQKFAKAKELGEASDEDDNALSWVEKQRRILQAKEEAAKRAKMLEEMDEALGDADKKETAKKPSKAYTSRDLVGLKVEHDRVSFLNFTKLEPIFTYFVVRMQSRMKNKSF